MSGTGGWPTGGGQPGGRMDISGSDEERTSVRYSGQSARGRTDTLRSDEERISIRSWRMAIS